MRIHFQKEHQELHKEKPQKPENEFQESGRKKQFAATGAMTTLLHKEAAAPLAARRHGQLLC